MSLINLYEMYKENESLFDKNCDELNNYNFRAIRTDKFYQQRYRGKSEKIAIEEGATSTVCLQFFSCFDNDLVLYGVMDENQTYCLCGALQDASNVYEDVKRKLELIYCLLEEEKVNVK